MNKNICMPLVLILISLSGCLKISKKGQKEDKAAPEVQAAQFNPVVFETELQALPEPMHYQFRAKFPLDRGEQVRIMKTLGTDVTSFDISGADSQWIDVSLKSGEEVRYDLGVIRHNQFHILQREVLKVPADFIFSDEVILNQETIRTLPIERETSGGKSWLVMKNINRVFFQNRAILTTLGNHFLFDVDELYFHNAVIRTFAENQIANVNDHGRHGGKIVLKSKKAKGELIVEMRGENGGLGIPGREPDESKRGHPGEPGLPPPHEVFQPNCSGVFDCPGILYMCRYPAPPGGQGRPGKPGYKGGDGRRGGDSGSVSIQIIDTRELDWSLTVVEGKGGDGGVGGAGGVGGLGGTSWVPRGVMHSTCGQISSGPTGPPGEQGPPGQAGSDGRRESQCALIQDQMQCQVDNLEQLRN